MIDLSVLGAIDLNHTELALNQTRLRLLETAVEGSTSGITIADATRPDMPLVYANPSFYTMTGYTVTEVIGRNCRFLQGSEPNQPGVEQIRHAIAHQHECRVELRNYRKDGSQFWNELLLYPLHAADGRLTHYVGVQNDITGRKQIEAQLRQSEARYRTISELTSDYVYKLKIKSDGRLISRWVAGAIESLTQYTAEELDTGSGWGKLFHPDDQSIINNRVPKLLNKEDSICEFRIITKLGEVKWIRDFARPIFDLKSKRLKYILGAAKEITAEKEAQEILIASEKLRVEIAKEREMIALRERFMATVSHDFRTPFLVINLNAQLLQANFETLSKKKVDRHIGRIQQQVANMTQLLDDVLAYSRGQAKQGDLSLKSADLHQVCLRSIEQAAAGDQAKHQIDLEFNCANHYHRVDTQIVQRILINLLSNAIKYSKHHSRITLRASDQNRRLTLQVQDEGIGIPASEQQHLFDPFYRASNAIEHQGTGLGLSIVKQSVEQHGGSITCHSEQNKGTTFTVTIPLD